MSKFTSEEIYTFESLGYVYREKTAYFEEEFKKGISYFGVQVFLSIAKKYLYFGIDRFQYQIDKPSFIFDESEIKEIEESIKVSTMIDWKFLQGRMIGLNSFPASRILDNPSFKIIKKVNNKKYCSWKYGLYRRVKSENNNFLYRKVCDIATGNFKAVQELINNPSLEEKIV